MSRRRGFGSIRRLPSGRFQARYPDENGERVALEETFESEKAAGLALAKVQTDLARGVSVSPKATRVTLGERWEDYRSTKTDWKPRTRQEREGLWRRYIGPTLGDKPAGTATPTMVRGWYATLHSEHPAAATGAYRLLRQLCNAGVEDGWLVTNPCRIKGAGVDRTPERSIATVAEVEAIVKAMPDRLRLLVLLAIWAGLRRSELLGLRRRDLDVVHRTVNVAQTRHELDDGSVVFQPPKTDASRRTVAFPSSIAADVERHLAAHVGPDRDALVFTGEKGGPLRPHVLGAAFRHARAVAGRPDLTLHDLRHTADTLAAATGATLPELMHRMGHATPHSALRYLHATKDRDRVIAEAMAELRPSAAVLPIRPLTQETGR